MKIFSIKSPLFWIILVLVVFAVAGGFWYIKTPFEKIELSEVVLNSE
jgi:hypothetical protein